MSRVSEYLREVRPTVTLALPIVVGQLSQMLMGVLDSAMIGHAGTVPLAASAFGNSIFNIFYVFGIGVMTPVAIFVSRARGARTPAEAAEYLRHGIALAVVLGGLETVLMAALDQVLADRPGGRGGPISLPEPEVEEELSAALMLRAVIQAVKCDGELDDEERERLVQAMGEASQREVQAVQAELQRPVDVSGLARAVPAGLEPQVYTVSLMAIRLDQKAEAEYLHQLAGALDLSPDQVNAIHDRAGAPRLYR